MTTGSHAVSWMPPPDEVPSLNRRVHIALAHIFQLAAAIEHDPSRVEEWYRSVRIREFGGQTAKELVMQGRADLVIGFLRAIRCAERD
jgi:hypothetical protein